MSTTLPLAFSCRKFFVFYLFFTTFINSVHCVRSSSAESTGATGSSPQLAASSLVPTSSSHHHRGDRELISAQFRAVQDARDLDTSESSVAGLESLSAAAAAAAVGLEDGDPLALSKYMTASASAYPPTKIARLNRYTQTGFYDPYPTYAAAALNTVPSSYYPYNAYSTYRDTNPMLDTYPYYERDRIRELRERAMQASQSAPYSTSSSSSGGSSNRDGYSGGGNYLSGFREGFRSGGVDHDSQAMSSGHGHEEGHGHGWGWGMYTSKVNTNAIGLLGLLGLLSLLSNVLMQFTTTTTTTTTAMMGGRRKRRSATGQMEDMLESREEKRERIFMEILPHLTPVAHARDGVIPLECTFHGVCMANRVLVDEFGVHGRAGGMRISSAIVKLLEKVSSKNGTEMKNHKTSDKASKYSYTGKKASDIRKRLESAGLDGRNKKDCEKSYPVCNALQSQKMPNFPFIIRMQDLPMLISKANKLTGKQENVEGVPMKL